MILSIQVLGFLSTSYHKYKDDYWDNILNVKVKEKCCTGCPY